MKIIKDYFEKKKIEDEKKEKEYRIKLKQEADEAKKEIIALKELEKDKKTIEELRGLRTKLKPQPKWSKAIVGFMDKTNDALNEMDKVNRKMGLDKNNDDKIFDSTIDKIFIGEPSKSKKNNKIFDI